MILRGDKISESAVLTPNRELFPIQKKGGGEHPLFEEEYTKAFEKGKMAGIKEQKRDEGQAFATTVQLLQRVAHRLLEHKNQLLHQLKPEVIEFALKAAKVILREELKENDTLISLINISLNQVTHYSSQETITLFLSPLDFQLVNKRLEEVSSLSAEVKTLNISADPKLVVGDFRIETPRSLLHFSLEREFEQMKHVCEGQSELCPT